MKKHSKILSIILAIVMVLTMSAMAFAEEESSTAAPQQVTKSITINDKQQDMNYTAYQIFAGRITSGDDGVELADIEWGNGVNGTDLLSALKADATIGADFANCNDATAVANVLSGKANVQNGVIKDLGGKYDVSTANAAFLDAFAKVVAAKLAGNGTASAAGTEAAEGTYNHVISDLPQGYYIVKSSKAPQSSALNDNEAETLYILQLLDEDITIKAKTDTPTIEKKIVENKGKENEYLTDYNTAGIGETVDYQITVHIPDMASFTKYKLVVKDHLSKGLTYINSSLAIKVGDTTIAQGPDNENYEPNVRTNSTDSHATGEYEDSTSIEIVFGKESTGFLKGTDFADYQGQDMVITYQAYVNEFAKIGTVGNPNEVKLEYSNNPESTTDTTETPWDVVRTFLTRVELTKVELNDETKTLKDAEFKLESVDNAYSIVYKVEYNPDGTVKSIATSKDTAKSYNATVTTDANGHAVFTGLPAGRYKFSEVKAPAGYNLMNPNEVLFTINCNIDATENGQTVQKNVATDAIDDGMTHQTSTIDAEGHVTVTGQTDEGNTACTWSVTDISKDAQGKDLLTFTPATADDGSVGLFAFTVKDAKGSTLPSTGGMGTTILYIVGAVLVVAAAILLITKKRMAAAKNQ